jgi:fibronectin-binding autotransporter adhesin
VLTLDTGAFTRSAAATLLIDKSPNTGTVAASNISNTNNIVGPWAVVRSTGVSANASANGITYATVSGGNVVPFTGGTATVTFGFASNAAANYDVTGNGTLSQIGAPRSANTVRYVGTGATQATNSNQTLTFNGILNAGSGLLTLGTGSFSLNVAIGANNELVLAAVGAGITIDDVISGAAGAGVTIVGPNTVSFVGSNTFSGNVNVNSGTLSLGTGGTTGGLSSTSAIINSGSLIINRSNTITQGTSFAGISGSGSLTKSGAGTAILTAANTYTGTTTISGGTLQIGNNGATGALSPNSSITNNATLAFNRTNAVVQGVDFGTITSGTGTLQQNGTNSTLTLNTANTYAGSTTIGAGQNNAVVRAAASGALGSGSINFDGGGNASTARLELSGGITLSNPIGFTGRNGNSVAIQSISGTNTLSGLMTFGAGGNNYNIQSDAGSTLLLTNTGVTTFNNTTTTRILTLQGDGNGTYAGVLAGTPSQGTGALVKNGSGTWTLTGNSTYNGATQVLDGTLVVNGNNSGATGQVTVNGANARLMGTGTIGGATVLTDGVIAPGNSIGKLDFAASLELSDVFEWEFSGGPPPTSAQPIGADVANVATTLTIHAAASLVGINLGNFLANGDKYIVLTYNTAGTELAFGGMADDQIVTVGGKNWIINYDDTAFLGPNAVNSSLVNGTPNFAVTLTAVPEASSLLILGLGGVFAFCAVKLSRRFGITAG